VEKEALTLLKLPANKKAIIKHIIGGQGFQRKLRIMGIREGQIVRIITRQPFKGPITIAVCGCQMTLGRGMAHKIAVEVV
jgi:ferrous iron transport protein A